MKIEHLTRWDVTPSEAVKVQLELQQRIRLEPALQDVRLVAGADASFSRRDNLVYGAVTVFSFPSLTPLMRVTATSPVQFPYIPGLLTFREGPVLLECFSKLTHTPDVVLFDGQGIAHPRKMGIAVHLGILLDIPSVGCAKTRLYGTSAVPGDSRGSVEYLRDKDGAVIGACLRTRTGVRPVFISPGHRIDLPSAIDIVLRCTTRYRLPEPIRDAHRLAGACM